MKRNDSNTIHLDLLGSVCGGAGWGAPLPLPGVLPDGQFLQIRSGTKKRPLDMQERIVDSNGIPIGKPSSIGAD